MTCVFRKSKYYQQSKADPVQVAPPLGYDFLYGQQTEKKMNVNNSRELVLKEIHDKPFHKIISHKRTPLDKVEEFLKVSEAPRKTLYLPPTTQDFMRKEYTRQIYQAICRCFIPKYKPEYSMIELAQLIKNPRIQSLLHIEDYALSKFFFVCEASDPWKMKYLHTFFDRRLIEYPVECQVINHNKLRPADFLVPTNQTTIFEPPSNIEDVEQVKQSIEHINEINRKKDPLYSGVHFYFADFSKSDMNSDYFQREDNHFAYLQYFVTMLTGILANGQTAILKLCGAFKHKTYEYLFLLKLIFNGKVSLCKPLTLNPFLPDSYIICEYYNKTNGDIVGKFLLENYHLLKKYQEDQLFLDLKKIFREDLQNNLKSFNETLIHKGIEPYLKLFEANSNIEFYPVKDKILDKLPKFAIELEEMVQEMIKLPDKNPETSEDKTKPIGKVEAPSSSQAPVPRPGISGLFSKNKSNK